MTSHTQPNSGNNNMVSSFMVRALWVRALTRDVVLCSRARHFTLTVPRSTEVHKWVPAGGTLAFHSGGVEIILVGSCQ